MRRAWVLVAVLVLGAWTCAPPSGGGDDVAGMSTAGYAAVAAGEDWHYVGEAGEPAFGTDWANTTGVGYPAMSFRIRESGIVDLAGAVQGGADDSTVFVIPDGYRPVNGCVLSTSGLTTSNVMVPVLVTISSGGSVVVQADGIDGGLVWIVGQFFLDPPDIAP